MKKRTAKPTGRRYTSVIAMMKAEKCPPHLIQRTEKLIDRSQLMRREVSESLRQMADKVALGSLDLEDLQVEVSTLTAAWLEAFE